MVLLCRSQPVYCGFIHVIIGLDAHLTLQCSQGLQGPAEQQYYFAVGWRHIQSNHDTALHSLSTDKGLFIIKVFKFTALLNITPNIVLNKQGGTVGFDSVCVEQFS